MNYIFKLTRLIHKSKMSVSAIVIVVLLYSMKTKGRKIRSHKHIFVLLISYSCS